MKIELTWTALLPHLLRGLAGALVIAAAVTALKVSSDGPLLVHQTEGAQNRDLDLKLKMSFEKVCPQIPILVEAELPGGLLEFQLLDEQGQELWAASRGGTGQVRGTLLGPFLPGRTYHLRVVERGITGGYRLRVGPERANGLFWFLAGLGLALAPLFLARRVAPDRSQPRWSRVLMVLGALALMPLVVACLHELGHAVLMAVGGDLDVGRTDWLGWSGWPHVAHRMDALPGPAWEDSATAAAGYLLPMLVGLVLWMLRRFAWGRRWWEAGPLLHFWLGVTSIGLLGGMAVLPLAMVGIVSDGDYTAFVAPLSGTSGALAIAGLAALSVISVFLIADLVSDLMRTAHKIW
jgi:hypothetical protein